MPEDRVHCDICHRPWSSKLLFHCTSCAQAQLYAPRIQHTLLQLETDRLGRQIEEAADVSNLTFDVQNLGLSPEKSAFVVERAESQTAISEGHIQSINKHAQSLRDETESLRVELDIWKLRLSKRRAMLDAAKRISAEQQQARLAPLHASVKQTKLRWDSLYADTVQARVFLCREAALLYGLTQRKRKNPSAGRDVYYIGGLPIFDLRDLNSESSASFSLLQDLSIADTKLQYQVHLPRISPPRLPT